MKFILSILSFILLLSCTNVEVKNSKPEKQYEMMKIELYFFPSEVFENVRYSIIIDSGKIVAKNHDALLGTKDLVGGFEKELTKKQIDQLENLLNHLEYNEEGGIMAEDTWGCKMIINNSIYYESSDFSLDKVNEDTKKVLDYIIGLIPFEIELYGFS